MQNFQIKGAPTCRVAYVEGLFEKRSIKGADPLSTSVPKYNGLILIPKDDVDKMNQVKEAYDKAFQELQAKGFKPKSAASINPKNNCFVDGEVFYENTECEAFRNYMVLKVASKNIRPIVTDMQKRVILNGVNLANVQIENISDEELVSGDYVFANVSFWTYCNATAQGIGCNLHALMRVREGERIGGMSHNVDDYIDIEGYE